MKASDAAPWRYAGQTLRQTIYLASFFLLCWLSAYDRLSGWSGFAAKALIVLAIISAAVELVGAARREPALTIQPRVGDGK